METNIKNLQDVLDNIQPIDESMVEQAKEHTAKLAVPPRALGRLHDIGEKLCGIMGSQDPDVASKAVIVMAGDHGIVDEGVSAFPQEVTGEMVKNFLAGGAGINCLCRHVGAKVIVVDMGMKVDPMALGLETGDIFFSHKIAPGTENFAKGPAMTKEQAEKAILCGFERASALINEGVQVLGTGDMGIGNTTPSAAIGAVLTGASLDDMTGRGTGVDDEGLQRKKAAIQKGIDVNQPDPKDGLDVLAKVGGYEIAGIAGIVLAAAYHKKPVVIDGFISTAGALIAHALCPLAGQYMFAGHCSEEPGHKLMLDHLGLKPILDLGLRLGEGTGGALAMNILEASVKVFKEVLTFEQAGVTNKE
ncbi:nicotinate-nucleotide/dimethylbenzimidazole phosphoribosyltransferase [Desulfatibacillum aliphaticivorans]|uniref:Nicotinate-nucleotide--dimethylbenzimidazole phosphoribosyltransferase n=1 Tax=Desulfatibacillum aliphaticivorans TaxID=218208 RepID=B8FH77_DESAL|nr:nicotinate-nucleotide--dimethylbenzimidazole phosphoribosyltransferase [Desulfatibacillum aliphaticivorans]ACL02165.1 nicotinate-nucleotide/dimethylbenzimidazole phosphoribosyltransferase [Desulfatibacillum aliphaticivorans]